MKETLKQFIFRKIESNGYISDAELAKFCHENNWGDKDTPYYQAEVYKREYLALKRQKAEFDKYEDKTISSYKNSYKNAKTKYFLQYKGIGGDRYQPITKAYFNYLEDNEPATLSTTAIIKH